MMLSDFWICLSRFQVQLVVCPQGGHQALGPSIAPGQRIPMRSHPYSDAFSTYNYLPSEYDRAKLGTKFEQLQAKLAQVRQATSLHAQRLVPATRRL